MIKEPSLETLQPFSEAQKSILSKMGQEYKGKEGWGSYYKEAPKVMAEFASHWQSGDRATALKTVLNTDFLNFFHEHRDDFFRTFEINLADHQDQGEILLTHSLHGGLGTALYIKDAFGFSEDIATKPDIKIASAICYINQTLDHDEVSKENEKELKDKFGFSEDLIPQATNELIILKLKENEIDDAQDILDFGFQTTLTVDDVKDIFPNLEEALTQIEVISPQLRERVMSSFKGFLSFLKHLDNLDNLLQLAQDKPFLVNEALDNNKYGTLLFFNYLNLDEIAQENIDFLYNTKKYY